MARLRGVLSALQDTCCFSRGPATGAAPRDANYPAVLGHLPEGWWRDTQLVELLCCMATWRVNIDVASEDSREEFVFHTGLQRIARLSRPGAWRRTALQDPWDAVGLGGTRFK